jgi:hypothetical protein
MEKYGIPHKTNMTNLEHASEEMQAAIKHLHTHVYSSIIDNIQHT